MKTEFGRKSFCVSGANAPILARQLDSRVLFRVHVDELHAFV